MRNNNLLIFNIILVVGDFLALVLAFSIAYIIRVSISHQAFPVSIHARTYLMIFLTLMPFWILIFALLNLYSEETLTKRFSEIIRLFIGSFIGILFVVFYSYITNTAIFPARIVVLYGFLLGFVLVLLFRIIARSLRRLLFRYNIGINEVVLIGNNKTSKSLINFLSNAEASGYHVLATVNGLNRSGIEHFYSFKAFSESKLAKKVLTIIQTELYPDKERNDEILTFAQENHVAYRFVPGNEEIFTGKMTIDLFHSIPIIAVHQTSLIGWGRIVKRLFDVFFGIILFILSSPIMLIVIVILMFDHGDPIFSQKRLSRFGSTIKLYKFRTNYHAYHRMTPEQGFTKMGKPELAEKYRANGDFLENDPRISKIGHFLRKTSLDELPQLINVIKGDISLVGPRPLEPFELEKYGKKNLILSVKTGMTGLAVISGRRDISFEERRQLDLYYVQNWSFFMDLSIITKTILVVLGAKGAK